MTQGYLNNVNDFHGAVCVLLVGKNIFCCTMHNVDRKIFLSKKKRVSELKVAFSRLVRDLLLTHN